MYVIESFDLNLQHTLTHTNTNDHSTKNAVNENWVPTIERGRRYSN